MALVHGSALARSWTLQQVYASPQRRDMLHRKGTEANHNGEGITQPGADAKQTARQSRKNNYSFLLPLELLLLTFSWIYKTTASVNRKTEKKQTVLFFLQSSSLHSGSIVPLSSSKWKAEPMWIRYSSRCLFNPPWNKQKTEYNKAFPSITESYRDYAVKILGQTNTIVRTKKRDSDVRAVNGRWR